jgi:hypothetical protein
MFLTQMKMPYKKIHLRPVATYSEAYNTEIEVEVEAFGYENDGRGFSYQGTEPSFVSRALSRRCLACWQVGRLLRRDMRGRKHGQTPQA